MFLTDYDVYQTEKGRKLAQRDGWLDANGEAKEECANGHGAIMYFYDLSAETARRCYRKQEQDFSDPKNFPDEIVKAIKSMKMKRMSRGDAGLNIRYLLNDKLARKIKEQSDERKAEVSAYNNWCNKNFVLQYPFDKKMLKYIVFSPNVTEELKNEILTKLERIISIEGAIRCSFFCDRGNDIINSFNWSNTPEGQRYWQDIYHKKKIAEFVPKGSELFGIKKRMKQPKNLGPFYWHDLVWSYFRWKRHRNPLWK